jgi:hypothetical protein
MKDGEGKNKGVRERGGRGEMRVSEGSFPPEA